MALALPEQVFAALLKELTEARALLLVRHERLGRWIGEKRPRVRREAIHQSLDQLVARRSVDPTIAEAKVLFEHGQERKAQPGIVHGVVVAHGRNALRVRHLEPESQVAPETGRMASRDLGAMREIEGANLLEQRVVAAFL